MNKVTKIFLFTTIFLIPTYLIRFSVFGIPTNVLEILIYLTFVSFLLEKPQISWKEFYKNYKPYIYCIFLIFIGLILSTLINKNYATGFSITKGWFFDPILFSFVLLQKIKGKKDIENILKTLYFSTFVVSLIALEYFLYGHLTFDGRLQAFYGSPNYLAMFLAPSVFIGFYLIKNLSFAGAKKHILPATLAIILIITYFTYSYAAWIALIISLFIVAIITSKLNKKSAIISIAIITIAFLAQINNPKLNNIFSERSSSQSRIMIWKSSFKILKDNLVFGIGPGNFQNKYLEYQKYFPPYLEWAVPQPHNLYLAFWLQSGIIGFLGFIILIILWFRKKPKNSLGAALIGIMFYILIHGIFDTTYWKNDLAFIFWLVFSLGLLVLKIDPVELSVSPVDKK